MTNDIDFCCRLYKEASKLARQKSFNRLMQAESLKLAKKNVSAKLIGLKAAVQAERLSCKPIQLSELMERTEAFGANKQIYR